MSQPNPSSQTPKFRIFLSHAGEDKETIARPLFKRLRNHGLTVFLDEESFRVGDHCPELMVHAMETAPVGVFIMSPEFVAKPWPMRELLAFVRRCDDAKKRGGTPPLLIPVFYRFSSHECRDPTILKTYSNLFFEHGLLQRAWKGDILLKQVEHALDTAAALWGIENDVGASNSNKPDMAHTREAFIKIIQNRILDKLGIRSYEASDQVLPATERNPAAQKDQYTSCNMVPPNPPRLTLNYDSSTTDEGKLKAAVLRRSEKRTVAMLATGKGGVGKTCGLRGLGEDNEIKRAFGGGILYMELGNDATIRDIIQGIANIVKRTGGLKLAELIGTRKFVAEASQEASKWFSERRCLFLVDDVWHVNGVDSAVLDDIGQSVGTKSIMVYSTRDRYFVRDATELIEFKEKEAHGELSRQMLLTHAGFDQNVEYKKENKEAFDNLLSVCQGLPLGFGIIGCSVREYALDCHPREDAWCEFYAEVVLQQKALMTMEAKSYGTIPRIVDSSVYVLEKRNGHGKFKRWFRALSVVQKQQSVPVEMLQKLWSMGTLEETKTVVRSFADVSVVEMRRKRGSLSLKLHDLILDVAIHQAAEQNETESLYRTLVHNYMECGEGKHKDDLWRGAMNDSDWELCYAWWEVEDDGYIRSNVCRLLRNAGYVNQLLWLLLQPRWIVKRLVADGIQSLEKDLDHGSKVCRENYSQHANDIYSLRETVVEDHLRAIGWAARMSLPFVNQNPRIEEAWFQVHGRLLWYATQNELTREFVERMERFAPRPWLRASGGLLEQAGTCFLETVSVTGVVLCTLEEHDAMWIFSREGTSDVMYVKGYDSRNERYEECKLQTNTSSGVECASFLHDHLRAVTAHSDGRIRVWDTRTGVCQRIVECKSEAHKYFVQFLANGSLVACQMSDLSLQVRHTLSGTSALQPLRGHTDLVMCAAMSADGRRIVSGSRDHTVRVWNAHTGVAVGQPLRGHNDWVRCVAVSTDGSLIVSGSGYEPVHLWNAYGRSAVGQQLRGHTDGVRCVAVSADGSGIVSGSDDCTVRVWDALTGSAVGQPIKGDKRFVSCVGVNKNGTRIVSGSYDCTVRVWEALAGITEWHLSIGRGFEPQAQLRGSSECVA